MNKPQKPSKLSESEEKYKSLFDNANDGILLIRDEIIIDCNKRSEEMFGRKRDELIGKKPWDPIISPPKFDEFVSKEFGKKQLSESLKKETDTFEWIHLKKDGTHFHVEVSLRKITLGGEECAHAIIRDISERINAKKLLRKSESSFKALLNAVSEPSCLFDNHHRLLVANKSFANAYNLDEKQVPGFDVFKLMKPEIARMRKEHINKVFDKGKANIFEDKGSNRNYMNYLYPVFIGNKEVSAVALFALDITENKAYEKDLLQAYNRINELKDKLEAENIFLRQSVDTSNLHADIVGKSSHIKTVVSKALQVAQQDSTVLIIGETGTGKELIARGIHDASKRKEKTLITVNCAAIPEKLIESELFGHEKGSFTDAQSRKIGLFEVANGSTLFLDEIGELPLNLQSKLLRVLENHEINRIGNNKPIQIDVRIIAATNQNLKKLIEENKFRQDLYYRLNVFPIELPPLRVRKQDIKPLVEKFIEDFNLQMGKKVSTISKKAMAALEAYHWPGNVRELKNVIERSMITSFKNTLNLELNHGTMSENKELITLKDVERNYILNVLEKTYWKISGKGGAAEILGLNRNTLNSRIKKLGIKKFQHK